MKDIQNMQFMVMLMFFCMREKHELGKVSDEEYSKYINGLIELLNETIEGVDKK